MDRSGVDQKLVRRPHCSGATSGEGWQDLTAKCHRPSAHTVHFSAAFCRCLSPRMRNRMQEVLGTGFDEVFIKEPAYTEAVYG